MSHQDPADEGALEADRGMIPPLGGAPAALDAPGAPVERQHDPADELSDVLELLMRAHRALEGEPGGELRVDAEQALHKLQELEAAGQTAFNPSLAALRATTLRDVDELLRELVESIEAA